MKGFRPQGDTGFFLETSYAACIGLAKNCNNKSTKLKRQAERAHSDGLLRADDKP